MNRIRLRYLNRQDYTPVFEAMRQFTQERTETTLDELWLLDHEPVFTQGRAGKEEHVLNPHNIPIVQTDRGGQVTYHGPGQAVIYLLCDTERAKHKTQAFVTLIEDAMIEYLATLGISAQGDSDARGVYVDGKKIGSIGLRMTKRGSYHGLSLNVDMDLTPFSYINPCGYSQLAMTQIKAHCQEIPSLKTILFSLAHILAQKLGYTDIIETAE